MTIKIFIGCTIIGVLGAATPTWAGEIDSLVCFKSQRKLILYSNGVKFKKYKISLGANPKGPKTKEDDEKTPEGKYVIFDRNDSTSDYHKNLGISYPNKQDKILKRTGGDIKIHGLGPKYRKWGKLHRLRDWTDGCIAVTNKEIDEIYSLVKINTPIHIYP
jgi:murein L,D-transpeptidase YafK